jgi:AraC family transcriptional regulator
MDNFADNCAKSQPLTVAGSVMLEPQIVDKAAWTIVGLETPFIHGLSPETNAPQVIGPLWEAFCHRSAEVSGRLGKEMYGIIYGRPEQERGHRDELQYIAGVAVGPTHTVPPGMSRREIAAGTFAVFVHRGPIHKISATCREIYRVWLPQSAWKHAEIADVELYDGRFDCDSETSEMEYWISVTPKG